MIKIRIIRRFKFIRLLYFLGIVGAVSIFTPPIAFAANTLNAPLISQLPELKNGCEVTSLAMLLQYKGIRIDKMTLANQIIKDPTPYRKSGNTIYWGNPNTGFVGDITGRLIGYAAYHGPVYQLANRYTNSIDLTGNSFDVIMQQISRGKPVWVISTSTFDTVPASQWQTVQSPIGPYSMTFHEHSVLLTGYDASYVYFNDPLANIKNRTVSRAAFIRGWEQFGRQAITYGSSRGVLDSPVTGTNISDSNYKISGWFLDESGVSKIDVMVDGKVAGQAAYGDARQDVLKAYPQYNNSNAGYHYDLDTSGISNGTHTITIKETGKNGWTSTLPQHTITILHGAIGYIDKPSTSAQLMGNVNVSGWILDKNGVSKVEVLVDGALAGEAIYGDNRPDVKKAYPEYNNENAGYHYLLDTTTLNDGYHTISVKETGKNGQITILPAKSITISNVKGYMDKPASAAKLTGSATVSGWFLDASGVSKIEVLMDGEIAGQAVYGDSRPDVEQAFPEFKNGEAGYHYILDTTRFSDGNHTITVKETGINGKTTILSARTINIANVKGYMDKPASAAKLTGSATVSGWFLDASGVSKIEVLVDGNAAGEAVYGDTRSDVQQAFPDYKNSNAGYHYILNTARFSKGNHKITVRETGGNGRITTLPERIVTIL